MKSYLLLEAELEESDDFDFRLIHINPNISNQELHGIILNFVQDINDDGYNSFERENYYQIDFDALRRDFSLTLNNNLHISIIFGVSKESASKEGASE